VLSTDFNRLRLVALGTRQRQGKNPITVFRYDVIRVDLHRQAYCSIERAGDALSTMHAGIGVILDRFLSEDPDCVPSDLQIEISFADARDFDDGDEVTSSLKNIDGRKRTGPSCDVVEPVALTLLIKCILNSEQSVGVYSVPLAN
jgi:hypothetical protein